MSAIGGMFSLTQEPVEAERLAALGSRLERLGPDGGREVIRDRVGMTFRAFHTNAESRRERQPLESEDGRLFCWDGRLDNRTDLLRALHKELRGNDTDAAIAAAAFGRWGLTGVGALVGDFALALWDPHERMLWLARDCIGARTLYYRIDRARLFWSTDLASLLEVAQVPLEIDDEYVAGFLTRGPDPGLTPYVGVRAVRPAHVVRIDEHGRLSEHRFWSLDPHREIRYGSDAEYEEHFRTLFREAVRVRLRADRSVFAELSGGLDSSSIVCMADAVLKAGEAAAPALETVSYVFDEAPTADERRWIECVERHRGSTGHRISDRTHPYLVRMKDTSGIALPNGALLSSAYPLGVRALMKSRDARVLLTGCGGDEILHSRNNPMPELADMLAAGHIAGLHARLKMWSELLKRPYQHLLWNDAILPLLPTKLQTSLRSGAVAHLPEWLDDRFARKLRLRERMVGQDPLRQFRRPSERVQARGFLVALNAVAAGQYQELGGAETTYPYLDRRLVEFLQAIPIDQKMRPGQSRSIMRRALKGIVPDTVLRRRGKGDPTEVNFRALARDAHGLRTLLEHAPIVERGYVNRAKFMTAFDRAVAGREYYSGRLFTLLTVDMWLRAIEPRIAGSRRIGAGEGCAPASMTHAP